MKTPSVTTSMRVFGPDLARRAARASRPSRRRARRASAPCARRRRARRAGAAPAPGSCALRATASSSRASGTRVVLPAPGGATSTADVPRGERRASSASTASMGRAVGAGMGTMMIEPHSIYHAAINELMSKMPGPGIASRRDASKPKPKWRAARKARSTHKRPRTVHPSPPLPARCACTGRVGVRGRFLLGARLINDHAAKRIRRLSITVRASRCPSP